MSHRVTHPFVFMTNTAKAAKEVLTQTVSSKHSMRYALEHPSAP